MLVLGKKQIRGGFLIGSGFFIRGKDPSFPSCFFGCGGVDWSNEACKGDFCGCC